LVTNDDYQLGAIIGETSADTGVPHGDLLVRFTEAVLGAIVADQAALRGDILAAMGAKALVDVCATIASFNAVVKIANGTGIPLEPDKAERTAQLRAEAGIDRLRK